MVMWREMMNIRESERERTEERWGQKEMRRQWKRSNRIYYLADSMSSESYDHDTQYNTLADSKIRLERERECVCVGDVFINLQLGTGNRKTSRSRRCLRSWDVQRKVSPQMKGTTALPSLAPTSLRRKWYSLQILPSFATSSFVFYAGHPEEASSR
jgi:hypothetical protein